MRASEPAAKKYKKVCVDFPNLAIITKSATTGEVQPTFAHATVGNKSLGESVVAFALAGNLDSTSVVSINTEITFATDGDKIRLPITEILLRDAAGDLKRSKKQQDCTPRNAVLLPPLLTEAVILNGGSDAGDLLGIFARSVTEWAEEGEDSGGDKKNNDDNKSEGGVEAEGKKQQRRGNQSRPPPRRWSPSQTIAATSWPSSRLSQSSHHESPRRHSLFMRTSA